MNYEMVMLNGRKKANVADTNVVVDQMLQATTGELVVERERENLCSVVESENVAQQCNQPKASFVQAVLGLEDMISDLKNSARKKQFKLQNTIRLSQV